MRGQVRMGERPAEAAGGGGVDRGLTMGKRTKVVAIGIVLMVAVGAVWVAIAGRFADAREQARATSCLSNVKALGLAMLMYSRDHDDQLPPRDDWECRLAPRAKGALIYDCPSTSGDDARYWHQVHVDGVRWSRFRLGFACSAEVAGQAVSGFEERGTTPMLWDATPDGEPAFRHGGQASVVYLDAHAARVEVGTRLGGR